jgi:outer membrane protein insertion porin family
VQRYSYTGSVAGGDQLLVTDKDQITDDAIGGKAYYLTKAELEIPLGAGAAEMGLRPSIFVMAGSLFSITKPGKTIEFEQAKNTDGSLKFNTDGSPSLLPKDNFVKDSAGNQYYIVSASDATNSGALTTCAVGYSASATTPCAGTSINAIYNNQITPFYERYVGDSAMPRISIGFGVNWNSPFGPLRIDVAKTLLHAKGDDTKLVTFNVGTQF